MRSVHYETPVIGSGRGFSDLYDRTSRGLLPTLAFGAVGTVEQALIAPLNGQVPLIGGFTLATPWSAQPSEGYVIGQPGQSQDLQWGAHQDGQVVLGPVRTHTTGLMDYVYRSDVLGMRSIAGEALELVHPGRTYELEQETLYGTRLQPSSVGLSLGESGSYVGYPDYNFFMESGGLPPGVTGE